MKKIIASGFLLAGIGLLVIGVVGTLYEGIEAGFGTFAIAGAVLASGGLISLPDGK